MRKERILILGAAGRDFHNFNMLFRNDPHTQVVGFTAAQIPRIECRIYPPALSGTLYPQGLSIWPEEELERVVKENGVDRCILSYSDLSHMEVMKIASRVLACGADFSLLGHRCTMLRSTKPVIAVCAVRTGCGKSQTVRYVASVLKEKEIKAVVVRHPMPYGDLTRQAVQRFSSLEELDWAEVTLEEREEYEAHLRAGSVVYAGVDYKAILKKAEEEAEVVLWDGGNNDLPFFYPDLWIVVADALRPGLETTYHPGETNFRAADVIVINKADAAMKSSVDIIRRNAERLNPRAVVITASSEVIVDNPQAIKGKRVLVIEDGPSLTHGGMAYGAGKVAAEKFGAVEFVDPRPFSVGSIQRALQKYQHIGPVLPAMGYYPQQIKELEQTISKTSCDSLVVATPVDLCKLMNITKPVAKVTYELRDLGEPRLRDAIQEFLNRRGERRRWS
jgi:predicted GTPase